ncbi:hypothetical protein [Singulisphaera acidiphila]|uniref:Uncharacterized protein n=1 Tax=Singulisphaera acidiphila (strain ATCC BAA-1392 / DSM 18658 / VKM B-2454 / MOB10) TaxID=886293 RepID=L0DHR4_SINAD|nr:hypothetical protein [Singulisphaera acidiphila]AGA28375.1 hypothetical protein Sinac_4168 [Singulisphaera acidiphila DSM 18658]
MTNETSDLVMRIATLEAIANELEQIVLKLQQRIAAAEQGLGQRWV